MIGQSIAHYRITAKLGEGGMGEVYRATDTKLSREVAIKVLPASVAGNPDRLARFEREARTLAALDHPNIAAVYGVESGALIMQLIEGPTLADRLQQGPLPADEAANLAGQIADALEAAHEKGIIHRDLKPANIKITPDGQVKLLDFGLAKAMESNSPASNPADSPTITQQMSMAGVVMGTAGYMSPEQTRGARVDHRTDIWAFGVVLYEMLTGRMLFPGQTATDRIAAVLKSEFTVDAAPARFRPLLLRCLERDPRKRLGWISEARRALDLHSAPDATPRTSLRWRTMAVAAALLIAGAATGALLLNRFHRPASNAGLRARPITRVTSDGRSFRPAISPDGKFVAYLSRRGSSRTIDLWIQQTNGNSSIRLAQGLVPFSSVVFSADSTKVYFSNASPSLGIYEVPTLGGDPQLAIPDAQAAFPSPDGQWIAYRTANSALMLKPAAGGQPRQLLPLVSGLVWSHDSKFLLVAQPRQPDLLAIPMDGSKPIPHPTGYYNLDKRGFSDLNLTRVIAWLPSNDLIFTARFGDASNLFRMPLAELTTAQPQPVTFAPWFNDDASGAGNRLVFTSSQNTNRLWTIPADADAGKVLGELRPITPEQSETQFQDVSPDGNTIVFVSRRSQGQGVFALDKRTGKERTIFIGDTPAAYSTFSPDGSQIAIGKRGVDFPTYILPAGGGEARSLGPASGRIRGWSPDGRYLLIWRQSDPPDSVYVLDIQSGKSSPVISVPGRRFFSPAFSPDGKWIAFRALTSGELFIAPFRGPVTIPQSDWIKIADGVGGSLSFWSPDSKTIYYSVPIAPNSTAQRFYRQPLTREGRPAGSSTEFLRLDDYILTMPLLNTIKATKDAIYLLLNDSRSDIWATDLQ